MVVAILGQDSPRLWLGFRFEICLILRINMVCLSCFSGTQWFNWEPFICSLIGISSMIGLVGYERGRSRTPIRRSADERQPLPRSRSDAPVQSTSRPSFLRFHYDETFQRSPPAICRRSPSPLQRRPQEPTSLPPHQQSFSSQTFLVTYDPFNPLQPPITFFWRPSTLVHLQLQCNKILQLLLLTILLFMNQLPIFLQAKQHYHRTNVPNLLLQLHLLQVALEHVQIYLQCLVPDHCHHPDVAKVITTDPELTGKSQSLLQRLLHLYSYSYPYWSSIYWCIDNTASASRRPKDIARASSPAAGTMNLSAESRSTNPNEAKQLKTREKGQRPSQPSRPPIQDVVPDSTSECTYLSVSSDSEEHDPSRKQSAKLPPKKSSITKSTPSCSKARVLTAMVSDESVSPQDFDNYLKRTGLQFFNPKSCTDEKPYECICIFGPPNVGKSEAASSLMQCLHEWCETIHYQRQVLQVDMQTQQYKFLSLYERQLCKWYWDQLEQTSQSFQPVVFNTPGRHMIVIEGHRLFESAEVMEKSDYTVILTGSQQTLRSRKRPTSQESLDLYCARIKPWVKELNASRQILKIDARSLASTMSKKIATYVIMRDQGMKNAGRTLSDTTSLLEIRDQRWQLMYYKGKEPPWFVALKQNWLLLTSGIGEK